MTIETANVDLDEEFCQTHPWAQPGAYVLLTVSDTGAGIPDEIRERVFEPFFTTKGVGEGTGLGLATVYAIVERHGGMVDFVTGPDEGTLFRIHLRACEGAARTRTAVVEDGELRGNGELILIAEDDELVRNLACQVLQEAGYRILVTEDGRQAVDRAGERGDEIAAALVDVVMPELGGREVHEFLSTLDPPVPTLFSSGYGYDELVKDGVLPANSELLQKPYSPKDLLIRLSALLGA